MKITIDIELMKDITPAPEKKTAGPSRGLALPVEERKNFLRVRLPRPHRGSCL